jgi:hypothetical protein
MPKPSVPSPLQQVLQLPGVQRQGHQAHHHAVICFAGMARQIVVGVVVVVDVGNRQIGFEDGGLDMAEVGRPQSF